MSANQEARAATGTKYMYPQFFGFQKLPFRLRPDPDFLYLGKEYRLARAAMIAAIRGSARVVLFLGPPGVGKTLLMDDVVREMSGHFAACRINQPHISGNELLQAIVMQLGTTLVEGEGNQAGLLADVAAALAAAGSRAAPPIVVVDDAHLLSGSTLVMLADLLARAPRLKIVLVGQDDPQRSGGGLGARVVVSQPPVEIHLGPLRPDGAKAYIEYRLKVAGGGGMDLFTDDAHAMIFQHTNGSPRLINGLCDAALHAACLRAAGQVSAAEVLVATQDARWPDTLAREKARSGPGTEDAAPAASGEEVPVAAVAQLLATHRKQHVATWPLQAGRVSIGRASDNDLRLEASFISRHHCQIVTVGTVSIIEDLGSVNGIVVNGKLVKKHVLQHADQIVLGEHVLTYLVT
ncbi:MAG: FHA domain-containing protein [Steroidobacteraceae bacterium]